MNNYIYRFSQWILERWEAIAVAIAILVVGWALAKWAKILTRKMCSKLKINTNLEDLIVPVSYWGILLISTLLSAGTLMSRVFSLESQWLFVAVYSFVKVGVVFSVGMATINLITKIMRKMLAVSKVDITLHSFLCSATKCTLILFLCIACIDLLGIPTSSVVAAIASAGLAISLAMQNHLSNLIGGVVILMTKPFVKGDYIEMDGVGGTVEHIELIYTTLKSFDNKTIHIPNNDAAKAKITNHSEETKRRLDLTFSIGYHDDYGLARQIILEIAHNTGLIYTTPEPVVRMVNHGQNSIDIACRLWVEWKDYYELGCQMREGVKAAFDSNGITIPYNQITLHVVK